MANKRKIMTASVSGVIAVALLIGGTFAWQSINQTALNEASDVINPGGRLHDDFDGSNKDVYVENFADEDIFARIRLEEYFEIVLNYGTAGAKSETLVGSKNDNGTYNYVTHYFDVEDEADKYWDWTFGGSTTFMPTFNKNKDSLAADINGIYELGNVGTISNRDGTQYTEYTEYTDGETKEGNAIYDIDANTADELTEAGVDVADLIDGTLTAEDYTDSVTLLRETHTAKSTGTGALISMAEWLAMVEADGGYNPVTHGNYWVYDTDGWVYWSAPIAAGEATGLLLDGIEMNQVMDDTWYYAINVVAQFVTTDDIGKDDNTGFYDTTDGNTAPTADAETLLAAIDVDATFELTATTTAVNFNNEARTTGADLGLSAAMNITNANAAVAYAAADGVNVDLSAITFSVANSTSADTKVENGKLILGEDETATTMTLNAQYGAFTESVDISVDYFTLACWKKTFHFDPDYMTVLGENNTYDNTSSFTMLCQIYTHDGELLNLGEEAYAFNVQENGGTYAYTSLETANSDDDSDNDGHSYAWVWLPDGYQMELTVTWEGRTEIFTIINP